MRSEGRPQDRRRGHRSPSDRRPWQFSLLALFVLTTIWAVLLSIGKSFPFESFIFVTIAVIAAIGVALYVAELVVFGWIIDFHDWMTTPTIRATQTPLECEQIGEIVVVKLSDTIVTDRQCRSVQKQLQRLIDEQHCDFVLDFSCIGKLSSRFRGVMIRLTQAARSEAGRLGKPYRPIALPPGEVFRVFDDRQSAVEEMGRHEGHGWVVLCSVPTGIRAVSEAV